MPRRCYYSKGRYRWETYDRFDPDTEHRCALCEIVIERLEAHWRQYERDGICGMCGWERIPDPKPRCPAETALHHTLGENVL